MRIFCLELVSSANKKIPEYDWFIIVLEGLEPRPEVMKATSSPYDYFNILREVKYRYQLLMTIDFTLHVYNITNLFANIGPTTLAHLFSRTMRESHNLDLIAQYEKQVIEYF